jgi:hypothetical protein
MGVTDSQTHINYKCDPTISFCTGGSNPSLALPAPATWYLLLFSKEAALLTITVLEEQVLRQGLGYSFQSDSFYFIHDTYGTGSAIGTWANAAEF